LSEELQENFVESIQKNIFDVLHVFSKTTAIMLTFSYIINSIIKYQAIIETR